MYFETIGEIEGIVPIAVGTSIRDMGCAAAEALRDWPLAKTEGNSHYSPEKWRRASS